MDAFVESMVQVPHTEILGIKTACDFGICAYMCRCRPIAKHTLVLLSANHPIRLDMEFSTYAASIQIFEA